MGNKRQAPRMCALVTEKFFWRGFVRQRLENLKAGDVSGEEEGMWEIER